jgi:hypothetical protein
LIIYGFLLVLSFQLHGQCLTGGWGVGCVCVESVDLRVVDPLGAYLPRRADGGTDVASVD